MWLIIEQVIDVDIFVIVVSGNDFSQYFYLVGFDGVFVVGVCMDNFKVLGFFSFLENVILVFVCVVLDGVGFGEDVLILYGRKYFGQDIYRWVLGISIVVVYVFGIVVLYWF